MKTIDTRDLYERKCELEDLRDAITDAREELDQHVTAKPDEDEDSLSDYEQWEETKEELEEALRDAEAEFDKDEAEELGELENLESEIPEFMRGEALIPEDDFEDYARQLADDIGAIDSDANWPTCHIDWEAAAADLRMDYTEVEYQGETYLARA